MHTYRRLVGGALCALAVIAVALPAPAQEEDRPTFQLTLTPGVGIPMGDFTDDLEAQFVGTTLVLTGGFGAEAGFAGGITANYFLTKKISLEANVDGFIFPADDPSGISDVDIAIGVLGFTGGARYWFAGDRTWTPYLDAAAGMYSATVKVDVGAQNIGDVTETEFGFNVGAGVDWALGEHFAIGPVVRYHTAFYDNDLTFQALQIAGAISVRF